MHLILSIILTILPIFTFAAEPKKVEITQAKRANFTLEVNLIGVISPRQEINFIAKYDGILTKIYFQDGMLVKKGEIIAQMENDDLNNAYKLALDSEVTAHEQYTRALKLYNQRYLNKDILDDKKQKWYSEKQTLNKAHKALENSYIKAPFNGKLGVFKAKQGSFLKTGSEIVTFYNPDLMQIDLSIPEHIATQIKVGSEVILLGESLKISSIEHIINPQTRMVDAKIYLPNIPAFSNLLIGNIVELEVVVKNKANTITIPKSALFIEEGQSQVLKINNDKAEVVKVEIGEKNNAMIEILKGINEGDQIILFGQNHIPSGTPVTVYSK